MSDARERALELLGFRVVINDTLPPDVVEFRHPDGRQYWIINFRAADRTASHAQEDGR